MVRKRIITMVLVLVLFLSQIVVAVLPILAAIGSLLFAGFWLDLTEALAEIASEIAYRQALARLIIGPSVFNPILKATEDLPKLILLNPEIMKEKGGKFIGNPPVENMVNFMISILIPFYVFAFVLIAIYLIFVSASPMGRARAKSTLLKLIASVPIILLTIPVVQLFIDISEVLTASVLNLVDVTLGIGMLKESINMIRNEFNWLMFYDISPSVRHIAAVILFCMPVFIVIFIRYFIIVIYTIMFPLTVFMYAFHWTRRMGDLLLKQTIWWIFSQFMMAVILLGISVAALSLPLPADQMLKGTFGLAGFVALAVAPLITMALVNWGEMIGMMRDLMFTPWISLGAATIGLGVESAAGEEEVSPPEPIGPPRIPPRTS